jgi:hypothetical protein
MPKILQHESVLHDWVHNLTFQQQAILLTAMRGPDTLEKHTVGKCIIRYLRGTVLKPAGVWNRKNNNDFMWGEYENFMSYCGPFWDDHDQYPHHFIMRLLHCAEVVAYKHPDKKVAAKWLWFYTQGCFSFHMNPETEKQMDERLNDFGCSPV